MLDLMQIRRRRAFFDDLVLPPSEREAGLRPRRVRFSCPCCGYPTLGGRGADEICELCWWEDDGQDDDRADEVAGGPNRDYSLNAARENFQLFGVMYPPQDDTRVGGPDSEKAREIKAELIGVFEAIMKEPSAGRLNALWEQVRVLERELAREMRLRGKPSAT